MPKPIEGLETLSRDELKFEIQRGARFVRYSYCFSALLITWRLESEVHFIRPHQSRIVAGLKYTALSLIAGWWGIPWGPIFTIACIFQNFTGGRDVTPEIIYVEPLAEMGTAAGMGSR